MHKYSWSSLAVYFIGLFLLGFSHWLGASFDDPSIDQILYHLRYSEGLGIDIGRIFLWTFIAECVAFPLLFALAATALQTAAARLVERPRPARRLVRGMALPSVAVVAGGIALMAKLSVFSWVGYQFAEDRFSEAYVEPRATQIRPGKLKNLVLIYVESLEDTYADARIWGRDLLLPLRALPGSSFASYRPAPGTTWTMAAMVATQCGVPLRVVSQHDVKSGSGGGPEFLPGAVCLGDILDRHGYRNVFLGGAPLAFAGKGQFLRDHAYHDVFGREEWLEGGVRSEAFGEWGLFDEDLYTQARAKLAQLHASGERFNLTLLTLDTHNPHGFVSPGCRQRGVRSFEDIVECASHQLADFVQSIERAGYLEDTSVVVVGDHLAVSNTVESALRGAGQRRLFNRFISAQTLPRNTDELLPFDLYPSILEFIGFEVAGDRLGLGYSGFHAPDAGRSGNRLDDLDLRALSGSSSYAKLWAARVQGD